MSLEQVLLNSTVIAGGSYVFRAGGAREVSVVVHVTGTVTGTTPTLQFTISEVDPTDETTAVGGSASTSQFTATASSDVATLPLSRSTTVVVTWAVSGTSPSFGGTSVVVFSRDSGSTETDESTSYAPDPKDGPGGSLPLQTDSGGSLKVRGQVLTDEGSFRDNFNDTLTTAISGTVTFTAGSTLVQGVGTSFLSQLDNQNYIKRNADAETNWTLISEVVSDTELNLVAPYPGTTGTTGSFTNWITNTGSGASITVSTSTLILTNGLGNGTTTNVRRLVDYGPLTVTSRLTCSTRVTNNTPFFGFQDNPATTIQQAIVIFDPTLSASQVVFRTGAAAADLQSTTVTLPAGALTTAANTYQIMITGATATLLINNVVVAQHQNAIPDSYASLYMVYGFTNAAAVGSSATLTIDTVWINNVNRVEVANSFAGEPLYVQLVGKSAAGLPQPAALKYIPQYGTAAQALTITMASLVNAAARASTAVDNSVTLYEDVLIFVKYTTAAASTSTSGYINLWGYGTVDGGTTYPEAITGTDAAVTLSSPPNLALIAQCTANANAKTYLAGPFSFCRMYGLDRLPAKWGIVFENRTAQTLNATAGNFSITYQGVNGQIG